jgi:hypothetical protein
MDTLVEQHLAPSLWQEACAAGGHPDILPVQLPDLESFDALLASTQKQLGGSLPLAGKLTAEQLQAAVLPASSAMADGSHEPALQLQGTLRQAMQALGLH